MKLVDKTNVLAIEMGGLEEGMSSNDVLENLPCQRDNWCLETLGDDLDSVITNKFDKIYSVPKVGPRSANVYQIAAQFNSSPLKPHVFKVWLEGYDVVEKKLVLSDLTTGVRIPSTKAPPKSYDFYNHPSALTNVGKVTEHIKQGVAKGIFAGPFDAPPPMNYVFRR